MLNNVFFTFICQNIFSINVNFWGFSTLVDITGHVGCFLVFCIEDFIKKQRRIKRVFRRQLYPTRWQRAFLTSSFKAALSDRIHALRPAFVFTAVALVLAVTYTCALHASAPRIDLVLSRSCAWELANIQRPAKILMVTCVDFSFVSRWKQVSTVPFVINLTVEFIVTRCDHVAEAWDFFFF